MDCEFEKQCQGRSFLRNLNGRAVLVRAADHD